MAESRTRAFSKLAKDVTATGDIKAEGISSDVTLGGATVYATRSTLPVSGNSAGDQAYVTENNRLYIWNGSGWYNVALLNLAPAISSVQDSDGGTTPFALATDGTATTITITAADSDGDPITYSATADSDFSGLATISQADNVFTITPFSRDSASTTSGTITFTATDGINISSDINTFILNFISPLWDETVLSIGTSSTNSLDNSTFIDRSTNASTVTTSGSPVQTAFHPYLDYWSMEFDGDNDYLTLTSGALGSGDFTVECWINLSSYQIYNCIFDNRVLASSAGGFNFLVNASGYIEVYTAGAIRITDTVAIPLHTWTHVALVRSSDTWKIYKNGTAISGSYSSSANISDTNLGIATAKTALSLDVDFHGYISNLRTVAGTAVYTTNFTPPTEKLTAITNTQLLFNSNRFIDTSSNSTAITVTGTPKISAFNPFGQGSEYAVGENKGSTYFNGTTNIIVDDESASGAVYPADNDFTLSLWFNTPGFSNSGANTGSLFTWGASGVYAPFNIYATGDGSGIHVPISTGGSWNINGDVLISGSAFNLNEWNHVEFARSGSNFYIFLNGELVDTASSTSSLMTPTQDITIGKRPTDQPFTGYISDVQYILGEALHTTTFTPPTLPVTSSNSALYLPMDNAGIFDKTGLNTLTLVGNTSTSTTQTKYADTAIYFDGSGDYITEKASQSYGYGTSDFTIEFWMYLVGSTTKTVFSNLSSASGTQPHIYTNGTDLRFYTAGSDRIVSGSLNANQWYHVSLCRGSSNTRLFIDGTQVGSTYADTNNYGSSAPLGIGTYHNPTPVTTLTMSGYLENLQVLKGVAKYTANFTPPTQEQGREYQAED